MDLIVDRLVQQLVTLVANDGRAALIDEKDLARLGMATAREFCRDRVQRRCRTVG